MMPHSQINPFIARVATYLLEIATGAHRTGLLTMVMCLVGAYLIINNSNTLHHHHHDVQGAVNIVHCTLNIISYLDLFTIRI